MHSLCRLVAKRSLRGSRSFLQRSGSHRFDSSFAREKWISQRSNAARFLNPWVDLAVITPAEELGPKAILFSQSWAIVSVLLCGVSSASIMGTPHCLDDDKSREKPVLDQYGIMSEEHLHDAYVLACATSFYASGCALGLCMVSTCLTMVTPVSSMSSLVASHSLVLSTFPFLNALSGGLQGVAVAIGLDMTQSSYVAKMAYGAATLTACIISAVALSGQLAMYRAISSIVARKRTSPSFG